MSQRSEIPRLIFYERRAENKNTSLNGRKMSWSKYRTPSLSPEEAALMAEEKEELLRAWRKLPQPDRRLLEGKYFEGCSDSQLASIFHCRPDSIRMKLTRARKALLALLQKEGDLFEKP